jgi:hypothetical protein
MLLQFLNKFFNPRIITGGDGSPYLTRYTLLDFGKNRGRLFLHRFHRGDEDRDVHNHPWPGTSFILWNGYREERVVDYTPDGLPVIKTFEYRTGSVNWLKPDTFHRVDLFTDKTGKELEAWSLIWTGKIEQSWGFLVRKTGQFIPWRVYLGAKGLVVDEKWHRQDEPARTN